MGVSGVLFGGCVRCGGGCVRGVGGCVGRCQCYTYMSCHPMVPGVGDQVP